MAEPERYGKANGNGPLHLLADFGGTLVTLCGVKRFEPQGYPEYVVSTHGICPRCESIRGTALKPEPETPPRPAGPDLMTPALVEAAASAKRAKADLAALIKTNRRAYVWMKDYPEERKTFITQLREAGITLGDIGQMLGCTRERVRQIEPEATDG